MTQELQDGIKRLKNDALSHHLGIDLIEIKPGYAKATMEIKPQLLNGVGVTHGGAIFSLADTVFAAACNAHGPMALAINVHINFLKTTKLGEILTAIAQEDSLTHKTGVYRVEVRNNNDELVAVAEGLFYRKS